MKEQTLIGPFSQLVSMRDIPMKGPVSDSQLEIIKNAGVLVEDGIILDVGDFKKLKSTDSQIIEIETESVAFPGFIDPHTHICFAGSRANDYALRIAGKTYLEIAKEGGGIWQTVQNTRDASLDDLITLTSQRSSQLLKSGITTVEVKSGYGLNVENELKMLKAIREADKQLPVDLISTCLAAHMVPTDFSGDSQQYLNYILTDILPVIIEQKLSKRVDIFIEDGAFKPDESIQYLSNAKKLGFEVTIHGDQFTTGGSRVAVELGAFSADHLESSTEKEIQILSKSDVVATVLPGASLGLGMNYAPARKLLDAGNCVAIGSDWNPGSAPMGDLLAQASLLSASEKLTNAEIFSGITFRAAKALNLQNRGRLIPGNLADIVTFPCLDYREILYHQGQLKTNLTIKKGKIL